MCTTRSGLVDGVGARDDRDADLAGRDHLDVDAGLVQRLEERRRDAGVGAHARADDGELADLVVVLQALEADLVLRGREGA